MFRNISVIGLGKLGYPMAEFLSSSGAKISYDKDLNLVEELKKIMGNIYMSRGYKTWLIIITT